mgnify:CR=1 FL=1
MHSGTQDYKNMTSDFSNSFLINYNSHTCSFPFVAKINALFTFIFTINYFYCN